MNKWLLAVSISVAVSCILAAGAWVWHTESRVGALEAENKTLHLASIESWKFHTQTWNEVNKIDRQIDRQFWDWPVTGGQ